MRKLVLLGALLALPVLGRADVSGMWSGSAQIKTPEGESLVLPVSAEFKQQDKSVSGTIGKKGEEQFPIEKGVNDGKKISFEFTAPEAEEESGTRTYTVLLNVLGEAELQGEFDFVTNGAKVTGKVALTRAK
jgi:hypothetical protein